MLPGLGKLVLTVGSDPGCDVVLQGADVSREHARLTRQAGGGLVFVAGAGPCSVDGRALAAGEQVPFDFRSEFLLGGVPLPAHSPAISLSLMAPGQAQAAAGEVLVGRDPARASLVIQHPSVSSLHAMMTVQPWTLTDLGSTSGTYVGRTRLSPGVATALDAQNVVMLGPVPVLAGLLTSVAESLGAGSSVQGAGHAGSAALPAQAMPLSKAAAGTAQAQQATPTPAVVSPGAQAPRKNKTILGRIETPVPGETSVKSIGRTPDNDIVVGHPRVSSKHAFLHQSGGQIFIEDRGSANGTFVRGQRIQPGQRVAVQSSEKIYIGPMPLQIETSTGGGAQIIQEEYSADRWAGRPLYEIEAWSLLLEVPDRDNPREKKTLLDNVSFKALPGDMIALMGPSGAGKTTLLMTLNGYLPPTSGMVRINGEDLYTIYDTLRGSIGYVPQDDLVHPELTVFEAVRYSAKFRLPPDYSDAEIDARVEQTLKDLGLEGVKNLQIGKPEKKVLSGGQRKRVNIALELVTDPVILFLDEPTSGLAADDTTALISLLHDLTKATGKTILMTIHQPAKDEFEKFNNCLIMGYGGVPMFFGPTSPDAYRFFGTFSGTGTRPSEVDNPRDLFERIAQRERARYEQMKAADPNVPRGLARKAAALEWREAFFTPDNPTYGRMYSGRREIGTGQGQRAIPPARDTTKGQLSLLLSRYFKVKVRDVAGTAIMLAQAPIIGVLLAVVFGRQEKAIPAWCLGALQQLGQKNNVQSAQMGAVVSKMTSTSDLTGSVFFLVVAAIWFGTSNAAREIVSERAIYMRERMVNLGLLNYVLSKYLLLAAFCIVQCTVLLTIVFFWLGFPGGAEAFAIQLGALIATSLSAVSLGLLLSTLVSSSEAAMALTPIALIPQVVLGGLMVPMTTIPHLKPLMQLMPARWGFEAAVTPQRLVLADKPSWLIELGRGDSNAADFIEGGKFQCALAQLAADNFPGAWGFTTYADRWLPFAVLGAFALVLLAALCVLLKRRDPV